MDINVSAPIVSLEIDISELAARMATLRQAMTPTQFNGAMYGVMKRTGGHVRNILRQDLPPRYYVTKKTISQAVGELKMVMSPLDVGCTIPIFGKRPSVGDFYKATGGAYGWGGRKAGARKGRRYKGVKPYRITARILKDSVTTLPERTGFGPKPFRNLAYSKMAFSREGRPRLPIRPIVSVSIPQMPLNRSKQDVQDDIKEYIKVRLDQRIRLLIEKGR